MKKSIGFLVLVLVAGVLIGLWRKGEHSETPPPVALEESASPVAGEAPLQGPDVPASEGSGSGLDIRHSKD